MFQLAGQIPTPVLASILGLGDNTAIRWAALAARDWSQYAALRRRDHRVTLSEGETGLEVTDDRAELTRR